MREFFVKTAKSGNVSRLKSSKFQLCLLYTSSEAIIRVVSNAILNTLASASPEEWKDIKMGTLLREANSLIKVRCV